MELYNTFEKSNHLQPDFDKTQFDTIHGWTFGWSILEPINITKDPEDEVELSKRLSPGQKALYFFWYLDAEVTNGGFIQFYWNDKRKFLPAIIDGLRLVGDNAMIELVDKADKVYLANEEIFAAEKTNDDWQPLYDKLKMFDEYDSIYYKIHDTTMELIENYARLHPGEFVKLK